MNKYKYLLKNVGLLTISNLGSKILSFVLIPLYTSILTTSEYGTYDFYLTTVSLLAPILTLTIANGVMRFCLDERNDKADVFSIGVVQELKAIVLFSLFVFCNCIFEIIPILNEYPVLLILLFIGSRSYNYITLFCRGIGNIFDLAVAGGINSVSVVSFNVIFLLYFRLGLTGYFWANIIAYLFPAIYLFIRLRIWRYIKRYNNVNLKKEMFSYSKPMIFSNIGWWINNVSDRYIVTWICGVAANGIYSVAYKLPSVLNILQNIFNQAWALSAVKEINNESSKFYSKIYSIYNCGMVLLCSLMIAGNQIIARILFSKDFYLAWKYAPFLMISTVFGALIGLLEGIFLATKKSDIIAKTTCLGAIVNVILNLILIKVYGPIGAAIATMIAYIVVWALRLYKANQIVPIDISLIRDLITYVLLVIQSVLLLCDIKIYRVEVVQTIILMLISICYRKEIRVLCQKLGKSIIKK
ncbi:MAG: oligosaccharide flippase family protein [Anaerostipes sp.]|nr:oligosaccharide flippase family protein [Anaerostipes sp.]